MNNALSLLILAAAVFYIMRRGELARGQALVSAAQNSLNETPSQAPVFPWLTRRPAVPVVLVQDNARLYTY